MTLDAYRQKVEDLKSNMDRLYRMAVATQNEGYWDAYHRTKNRWKEARRYMKKRKVAA